MGTGVQDFLLNRRDALKLGASAASIIAAAGLTACSPDDGSGDQSQTSTSDTNSSSTASTDINISEFDALVASGSVADDAIVAANTWASAIKDRGSMRLGATQTSVLFSLLNTDDNRLRGFDAGLSQLLARYILGDEGKISFTQVTSDTRESVLQNDQVDTVCATYSITDRRKALISFAGPYYTTQQGILVTASNTTINGLDDLAGKNVATQSGSTGPSLLEQLAPDAHIQEFTTDEEARNALEQGRVDAYVIDQNLHMGSIVKNPGKYKLLDESFGPIDSYGIGLPLNSDGVDFVNAFLTQIEDNGTWAKLWKICIGERVGLDEIPTPPALGV